MSEENVCRVCLADNVHKMYRLKSNTCRKFYEKLVNSKIEDGLPETFCYICYALLQKSNIFSDMAQQSQLILTKLKNEGHMINKAVLSKLDRPKLYYAVNKPELVSIDSEIQPMDTPPEPPIIIKVEQYSDIKVECFEEDTCMNDIDISDNDIIDTNIGRNDNNNDANDEINDFKEVNLLMEQPIRYEQMDVPITEDRKYKVENINDNYNTNDNINSINDYDDVNLKLEQSCAVRLKEKVSTRKRKRNKKEETIKDMNKSKIRCYQNKKKINKSTIDNVISDSEVSSQHKVEDHLETYAKLSKSQSDNSNSDASQQKVENPLKSDAQLSDSQSNNSNSNVLQQNVEDSLKTGAQLSESQSDNSNFDVTQQYKVKIPSKTYTKSSNSQSDMSSNDKTKLIPSSSDNDTSKVSKPLKTVSHTQQLLWKQVVALLDKETQLSLKQTPAPSVVETPKVTPYNFVRMKENFGGYLYCSLCDYKCRMPNTFERHIESCKIKYELMMNSDINDPFRVGFACKTCPFRTLSQKQFTLHKEDKNQLHKTRAEKKCYICDICQYRCELRKRITRHLKGHTSKEYPCSQCDFISRSLAARRVHIMSVHNGLMSCKNCDFKCTKEKELHLHTREIHDHKPIQTCKYCDYKCALERSMNIHMWRKHEGAYKCFKCDFQCKKKNEFKVHLLCKHNEEKMYACDKCDYKTNDRSTLKEHTIIHTDDGYICDICNLKTHHKSNLRQHIKVQHFITEKNFLCQYCGNKFKTKQLLKRHSLIHGSKNFSCSICEFKSFTNKHLKRHFRKHTGEKPHECDLCGQRFTRRVNQRLHMQRCTKNTPKLSPSLGD